MRSEMVEGHQPLVSPAKKNASHHETENVGSHGKQPYVKNLTKAPISDLIENSLEDCRFELSRKLKKIL